MTAGAKSAARVRLDNRGIVIPRVLMWLAWNEPNNPAFLAPQWKKVGKRYVPQPQPGAVSMPWPRKTSDLNSRDRTTT